MDFVQQPRHVQNLDGTGKHRDREHGRLSSHQPHNSQKGLNSKSQSSSSSSSPVKAKQQHIQRKDTEEEEIDTSLNDTRELQDSILEFPTKNQPVIDTTLKDMLVSLHSTIHVGMYPLQTTSKHDGC